MLFAANEMQMLASSSKGPMPATLLRLCLEQRSKTRSKSRLNGLKCLL